MKKTKLTGEKEAEFGKKIALRGYEEYFCFREEGKNKLKQYQIGSNKVIDKALVELYRDVEVEICNRAMPKRIRIREGVSKLENLLFGEYIKKNRGFYF